MSEPDYTSRWQLPLLAVGQMQKEITHNEALARIDALLALIVESSPQNDPPNVPVLGHCWLIGPAPTGAWTGYAHQIGCWTSGGWRWVLPRAAMCVRIADGRVAKFDGNAWSLPPALAAPAGGTLIDSEARSAIVDMITALRASGWLAATA